VALVLCLAAAALAAPPVADAATNWTVPPGGTRGGTGRAEPLPAAPGSPNAACVSLVGWTIRVTWNAVPHTSTYTIYRSTSSTSSGFSVYATVGGGTTSYSDSNFSVLTSYWYRITATVGANWTGPQSASTPKRSISLLLVCT
jgi:hypothetical protein